MSIIPTITQIQQRADTAANFTSNNPILLAGEIGFESDTGKFKIGVTAGTAWNSLSYQPNLNGDITTAGNTATLATVNSNIGSFTNANITVNAKGLITAVANGSGSASIVTKTYSQLQTMVSGATLVTGQLYYISDKNVIIEAINTTQLALNGTYLYQHGRKAWGAFQIQGTSGSVSQITIGSDNLLTATQNYATTNQIARVNPGGVAPNVDISLLTLANNIAANVNSNSAINTKYKAYAVGNGDVPTSLWGGITGTYGFAYIIIEAVATGTTLNGSTISVTASSLTITSTTSMQGGAVDLTTPLQYLCTYDFVNDKLLSLYDPIYNNQVTYDEKTITGDLTAFSTYMFNFNWNNPFVVGNKLVNCSITTNFILAGSTNYVGGMAMIGNDLVSSTLGVNLIIAGEISHNTGKYATITQNIVAGATSGISGNELIGMIDSNYMSITPSDISNNFTNMGGIVANRLYSGGSIRYTYEHGGYGTKENEVGYMTCLWNVSGWNAVKSNQLRSRAQLINIVNTNGVGILAQNEFNDDVVVNDIQFDGSYAYFINNKINSVDTRPASLSFQHFTTVQLSYNIFHGNIFDGGNTLARVSIISGDSINMHGITLSGAAGSVINLHGMGGGGGWGHFTMDAQIQAFDGSNIGNIATHSLFSFKSSNTIVYGGHVYASGLTTSGSPTISLGIAGNNTAVMAATATSTLNTGDGSHGTGMTSLGSIIANAVTAFAPFTITVSAGAITAGVLSIHLECFRLDQ